MMDQQCWPRLNTTVCWMMLDDVGRCWKMLEDVGSNLNLLKIFVQHRAALLAQQCWMMLASFEQALRLQFCGH